MSSRWSGADNPANQCYLSELQSNIMLTLTTGEPSNTCMCSYSYSAFHTMCRSRRESFMTIGNEDGLFCSGAHVRVLNFWLPTVGCIAEFVCYTRKFSSFSSRQIDLSSIQDHFTQDAKFLTDNWHISLKTKVLVCNLNAPWFCRKIKYEKKVFTICHISRQAII